MLVQRIDQLVINGGNTLSTSVADTEIERLAEYFYDEIRAKGSCDTKPGEWETVDVSTLKKRWS